MTLMTPNVSDNVLYDMVSAAITRLREQDKPRDQSTEQHVADQDLYRSQVR